MPLLRPRPRRRTRTMAATLAVWLTATACSGTDAPVAKDDQPVRIRVAATTGVPIYRAYPRLASEELAVLGNTVLALSDVYATPLVRSTDGGRTWRAAATPPGGPGDRGSLHLVVTGGTFLVLGRRPVGRILVSKPFIWSSDDEGRSFVEGEGVGEGLASDTVTEAASSGSTFVVAGRGAVTEPAGPVRVVVWRSTDHGRTWSQHFPTGLPDGGGFGGVLPVGARLVAAKAAVLGAFDVPRLFASDDLGATWSPVTLEGADPQGPFELLSSGGAVVVSQGARAWRTDDGRRWTAFGQLRASSEPSPNPFGAGRPPQLISGTLFQITTTFLDPDRYSGGLARSEDQGRTWRQASLGVSCDPEGTPRVEMPVALGSTLVTTWRCFRWSQLLVSRDDGRHWRPFDDQRLLGLSLGLPVAVGGSTALILAGRGRDRFAVSVLADH